MGRVLSMLGLACVSLTAGACASSKSIVVSTPMEYLGPKTRDGGDSLIEQLRRYAPLAKPNVVFMVGDCQDRTGKYLDETRQFSRAVTQACTDILTNYLFQAGFSVAERNQFNLGLIAQEYQMGHQFAVPSPGQEPEPPRNVGLIQRGGPNGGLTGANYLLTGAITTYNVSVENGGGGLDVDAIGFSTRTTTAEVGTTLRIVDASTGLVVSSMLNGTKVRGEVSSFHVTRLFGPVTNTLATVTGGETSTTIERPDSDLNIASMEFGGAANEPIDYAVIDTLIANLARQLEAGRYLLYESPELVEFNYELPLEPGARVYVDPPGS